jgi:tRNA(Arg) A34 adenosine deaminase TadA
MKVQDEAWMGKALEVAREGVANGQSPFGACIVRDGVVVSCVHNVVWQCTDITAHAEVHAIRDACARLQTIDLTGCTLYSTCEPCPMCFSACHWARIGRIVYGARIADAAEFGFHELPITTDRMKQMGHSAVELVPDCLREEARALFREWASRPDKAAY